MGKLAMENKSVVRGMLYGGLASCVAETVTMPVDVVKTRMQVDGAGAGQAKLYKGTLDCAAKLARAEGPIAFWRGLQPALMRQSTYGSMRYGFYAPIRDMLGVDPTKPKSEVPLWKKIVAGACSGAVASAIANPTDLVKVRMQTNGMARGPDGSLLAPKYKGVVDCFATTFREEGIFGFWKGVGPTIGRATALAAAELASYDEAKMRFQKHGIITQDGLPLHASTALVSGYISTVASSPFDVVKSRVMGQPLDSTGRGAMYTGMIDCFVKTCKAEGFFALYNGFWPNFGRVVPRVCIVFVVMEHLKKSFG